MSRASHNRTRRVGALLAFALVIAACGDALGGVGDLSERVVHGDSSTTTSSTQPGSTDLRLKGVTSVAWHNDGLDAITASLGQDDTIIAVWLRGNQVDPFVQATRREIAHSLPGVQFPQLVPAAVTHVTSQMVYDTVTASLDPSTAAAFGLWAGEPYTVPRAEAQLAVLRVGLKTFTGDPEDEIFSFQVPEGQELAWTHGDYVYQLFCRRGISEQACFAMAESAIPLDLLLRVNR